MAQSLLPESELQVPVEEDDARMTTEQLGELGEALSILSAKSSVIKERDELRALMEENQRAEEVRNTLFISCLDSNKAFRNPPVNWPRENKLLQTH